MGIYLEGIARNHNHRGFFTLYVPADDFYRYVGNVKEILKRTELHIF